MALTPAGNIDEAIALTEQYVYLAFVGVTDELDPRYKLWLKIFGPSLPNPLDEENEDQRTVRDWFTPSLFLQSRMKDKTFEKEFAVVAVTDKVYRTLSATKFAKVNGRISAGQETDIVDQWNVAWADDL